MQEHLLDFPSVPATRDHFAATIKVIDAQIDEIDERKAKLQAARAALAAMAGIDRSEQASGIGKAVTAASRSIYEGANGTASGGAEIVTRQRSIRS